jgi:hypothetical protein
MSRSLVQRAACALVAASLGFSVEPAPAFTHPPPAKPGMTFRQGAAPLRSQPGWAGAHNREAGSVRAHGNWSWNARLRDGGHRGSGWAVNAGFSPWASDWSGYAPSGGGDPATPTVIETLLIITVPPNSQPADNAYYGGCVIHQLRYDQTGTYTGERQYSEC